MVYKELHHNGIAVEAIMPTPFNIWNLRSSTYGLFCMQPCYRTCLRFNLTNWTRTYNILRPNRALIYQTSRCVWAGYITLLVVLYTQQGLITLILPTNLNDLKHQICDPTPRHKKVPCRRVCVWERKHP